MSRGYVTRRLAIDRRIPLITNIKCAKLLVESLSRYAVNQGVIPPLARHDAHVSVDAVQLPALVNLFPAAPTPADVLAATRASVAGGFGLLCIARVGLTDETSVEAARLDLGRKAVCDYALWATLPDVLADPATATPVLPPSVGGLYVDLRRAMPRCTFSRS